MRRILLYGEHKKIEKIIIVGYIMWIKKVLEGEVLEALCMSGAAARTGRCNEKK